MSGNGKRVTVIGKQPRGAATSTTDDRSSGASGRVQQGPGLWRPELQQHDLSVPGREVVQQRVEIGPEAPAVKHTHPGEEVIYIVEGSLEYQVEGQPARTCHAGDALTVPAGAVHSVRNVGSGNAAELAAHVVEKGQAGHRSGRVTPVPSVRQSLSRPPSGRGEASSRRRAA